MNKVFDLQMHTENEPTTFEVSWVIENFLMIPCEVLSESFSLVGGIDCNWRLKSEVNKDRDTCKVLLTCKDLSRSVWIVHQTTAMDCTRKVLMSCRTEHSYKSDDEYALLSIPLQLKQLPDGVLVLNISMTVYGIYCRTKCIEGLREARCSQDKAPEYDPDFEDATTDYAIEVRGKMFKVHTAILKYRAHKFYQSHPEIQQKAPLALDTDQEAFLTFLKYVYSGVSPRDIELALHAEDVYHIAKKYDVKELHVLCVKEICSRLSANNSVKTLNLALQERDHILKYCVIRFLKENMDSVKNRSDWKELLNSQPDIKKEIEQK